MPLRVISSKPHTPLQYWSKILQYSFLIRVLSIREIKIKYSRTFFGIGWFFLQPIVVVLVYSIFFKYLIHIQSDGIPYTSFVFSGLVLWYLFTGIIGKCTFALIESSDLINKVSFPKLILLLSKSAPVLLECAVMLLLLFVLMLIQNQAPGLNVFIAIYYFIVVVIFSFTLGIFFSIAALKFRDLAHTIPFIVNFGIWLTPVFYPASFIPQPYKSYLSILNPLFCCIDGLRASLFLNQGISTLSLMILVSFCLLLVMSFHYFVKFEKMITENL